MLMKNGTKLILIVDDSVVILDRLIRMLEESKNIQFVHAGNYHDAIQLLNGITPDLVLLDIHLPDKSGIELLRTIKEKYQHIIVVMITNNVNDYYRKHCRTLGAEYFVDKSKDFNLIPEIISAQAF